MVGSSVGGLAECWASSSGALPRRRGGELAGSRVSEGIGRKRDERGGTA
jgi:hypothetical protein